MNWMHKNAGLYGLAIAITTVALACLITYLVYRTHFHTEETWIQLRSFLQTIRDWLASADASQTRKVGWLDYVDSKIHEIFKWLISPGTYVNFAATATNIFDKCLGLCLVIANFIANRPATFLATTLGLPVAHALNVLWVGDVVDGLAKVAKSLGQQMAGLITKLSSAYTEVGQSLKTFITDGIGAAANLITMPVNVCIQILSIVLIGFANILRGLAGLIARFANAISKLVNRLLEYLRSFFGGGGGGADGGGADGGGAGGGGPSGSNSNFVDSIDSPLQTFLTKNVNGFPSVRLGTDDIHRMYESAPGELPGHVNINTADLAASSSAEAVSAVITVMDVAAIITDAILPAAGSICGIIVISILLAPAAPSSKLQSYLIKIYIL